MSISRPALLDALRDFFGPDAPIVTKAIATKEAEHEDVRRAHGAAIAELERERDAKLPLLLAAHQKAIEARKALEAKLAAAQKTEGQAWNAKRAFSYTNETDIEKHRQALRETVDSRVVATAQRISEFQSTLMAKGFRVDNERRWKGFQEVDWITGSNSGAVLRRYHACFDALRACDALRESYVKPEELDAALEKIVAMIPGGIDNLETPTEPLAEPREAGVLADRVRAA